MIFRRIALKGITDTYDGQSVAKRYSAVNTMITPILTTDSYIVLLPTPGVAYWTGSRTGGSTGNITLTAVTYPDDSTLFPVGGEATVVDSFRYASQVIEIVPTVNSMSWGGAIEVWKAPVSAGVLTVSNAGTSSYVINGMEALNSVKPQSILPFNHGSYVVSAPTHTTNDFVPIMTNTAAGTVASYLDASHLAVFANSSGNFLGMGNMEAVFIRLPAGNPVANTALIRTWACVEFTVTSTSALYDFATLSPPHDPIAIELLRRFIREQPCAVPYYDNENYWTRVLTWIKMVSSHLRNVPGAVGEVAGITNLVSKTLLNYST